MSHAILIIFISPVKRNKTITHVNSQVWNIVFVFYISLWPSLYNNQICHICFLNISFLESWLLKKIFYQHTLTKDRSKENFTFSVTYIQPFKFHDGLTGKCLQHTHILRTLLWCDNCQIQEVVLVSFDHEYHVLTFRLIPTFIK
jgi:hypothetical protein